MNVVGARKMRAVGKQLIDYGQVRHIEPDNVATAGAMPNGELAPVPDAFRGKTGEMDSWKALQYEAETEQAMYSYTYSLMSSLKL